MTGQRRELMLRLCNGNINSPAVPILHFISGFVRCDEILSWLVRHRFTEKDIIDAVMVTHKHSQLDFVKFVLMHVDKESEVKPIYAGRDWKS